MAAAKSSAPLSRADVVSEVAAETQMANAQVEHVIRAFENSLKRALGSGGEVRMVGLGTFKVGQRAARMGRNPKTGEPLKIAASKNVRFSAGKAFKEAVSGVSKAKAPAKAPAKAAAKASAKAAPAKAAPAKAAVKPAVSKSEAGKVLATKAPAAKAPAAKSAPVKAAKKGKK